MDFNELGEYMKVNPTNRTTALKSSNSLIIEHRGKITKGGNENGFLRL